jgi:hypothetical protein
MKPVRAMELAAIFASFICVVGARANELNNLKPANSDCATFRHEIAGLSPSKIPTDMVPAAKIPSALTILTDIRPPPTNDLTTLKHHLAHGLEKNLALYLRLTRSGCSGERVILSRALLYSLRQKGVSERLREKVRHTLKDSLLQPRYPDLVEAANNSVLIKTGLDEHVWKLSDDDREDLKKIRHEVLALSAKLSPKFTLATHLLEKAEDHTERLKHNHRFQGLRGTYLRADRTSDKCLKRLKRIARHLN